MGINVAQFRDLVIRPTLAAIGPPQDSEAAVQLLLATALHESKLEYLKQWPTGPALGVYQMEPATHDDHCEWLHNDWRKPGFNGLARRTYDVVGMFEAGVVYPLTTNMAYATAMARVHYWRVPEALPEAGDAEGMAAYWKKYYNTVKGKGTEGQFLAAWERNAEAFV